MESETFTTEFQGFFAEFFDILHADCEDALLYPNILKPYGTRVLELGSGTGRIAVPLARAGYQVTGIEFEADMIALARKKDYPAEALTILQGDARDFSLGQTFDAILLPCNFLNHFPDSGDALAVLRCCKRHLAEAGIVIIDCAVPDYTQMLSDNGKTMTFEFPTARGTVIKDSFTPRYDFVRQIETDRIVLEEYGGGRLLRRAEAAETLTWYNEREVLSLIREAGLALREQRAALDAPEPGAGGRADAMVFFAGHGGGTSGDKG